MNTVKYNNQFQNLMYTVIIINFTKRTNCEFVKINTTFMYNN